MSDCSERVWLVTGGCGTFGRAALRVLLQSPDTASVRVFNRSEHSQAEVSASLSAEDRQRVRFILGDVRDAERVRRACRGATHILHAAALKRVEAVQRDVREGMMTNTIGSLNVAEGAIREGCQSAVLISSDKASNPIAGYGVSKLAAEHIFAGVDRAWGSSPTRLMAVRYGNVAGSRGSVFEIWRAMADRGEPIRLSHPEATRFFFSIDQGVTLALWAGLRGKPGHLYAPVMRAARMGDLAEATGAEVQSGTFHDAEKLHESIVTEHEARRAAVCWPDGLPFKVWEVPPVTGAACQDVTRAMADVPRSSDLAERITPGELALAFAGEDIWTPQERPEGEPTEEGVPC